MRQPAKTEVAALHVRQAPPLQPRDLHNPARKAQKVRIIELILRGRSPPPYYASDSLALAVVSFPAIQQASKRVAVGVVSLDSAATA